MLFTNHKKESTEFISQLTADIQNLERLIEENLLEDYDRIGAEQEFCLVDENFRANPINQKILQKIQKHGFVAEIAKFNMELNINPIDLGKTALRKMEQVLLEKMNIAQKIAQKHNSEVILTGILPTVRKHDLRFDNITNHQRYFDLCNAISESRGKKYKIRISGLDELIFQHDSPLIEGCNTGFQFHLQIAPDSFHRMYNFAQLIAAPVLATSVNSPLLFGKRLWNETRIAVFQQATDTRIIGNYHLESLPRVTFGNSWLKKSLIEIFKEDITRYKILLKSLNPTKQKRIIKNLPKLSALTLHNSTVYRWNRPCYGIYKKKPSIRIENRMLPAGPTILDEVANSTFWLGLLMFYKNSEITDLEKIMKFDDARINFYAAAQQGIDATFKWFGKRIDARKLILNELIPKAAIGLSSINIHPKDIDKYLNIIKERTNTRQNGSRWIIDSYDQLNTKFSKQNTLTTITSEIIRNQQQNIPVHTWKKPTHSVVINNPSKLLIEECMERDITSIQEDEIFELAWQINKWTSKNYMVVVNQKGHITGVLNHEIFQSKKNTNNRKKIMIKKIMKKKPHTISPDTTIGETLEIMEKTKNDILPVVENRLFIGIIQKNKLLQYENDSTNILSGEFFENYERIIGNYHSSNKNTIIFIAGVHGNEKSGVIALQRFFEDVKKLKIKIEGTIIGLIGNLNALKQNKRYINADMNRLWKTKTPNSKNNNSEENEIIIVKRLINKIVSLKKKKNICIIDLHNTSSAHGVFTIVNNDTEKKLASHLAIPVINKLLKKIKGSLAEYYHSKGLTSIVFEGGAIGDPAAINNHEAGIWKILEAKKMIQSDSAPNKVRLNMKKMRDFSHQINGHYVVKYIHKIKANDDFLMNPNMQNFEKVKKMDIIAHDKNGPITAPYDGHLLMPLYQEQGTEGFYIINNEKN
jgi:succinylglutamate desuccinylase